MKGLLPELDPVLRRMGTSAKKMENIIHMMISGKYQLDIVRLDDFLHEEHGYDEDIHGSMADFITLKWGEEARKTIERQIKPT